MSVIKVDYGEVGGNQLLYTENIATWSSSTDQTIETNLSQIDFILMYGFRATNNANPCSMIWLNDLNNTTYTRFASSNSNTFAKDNGAAINIGSNNVYGAYVKSINNGTVIMSTGVTIYNSTIICGQYLT